MYALYGRAVHSIPHNQQTTQLPIYPQHSIDDACTQNHDNPDRTADICRQFPREQFGWRWGRVRVAFRMGTLFFQLDYGRSFVLRIVCDTVLSQVDKGRVILLVPLLDLQAMSKLPGPANPVDEITLQHMTESRRKLGSCAFAL